MDPENQMTAAARAGRGGLAALRGNAMGLLVMLVLQYSLGTWVNLEATVPHADSTGGFRGAFVGAITNGPIALTLHALLGTLLLIAAVALIVRALSVGQTLWTVLAIIGFLSIVFAWITGVRFTTSGAATA